MPPTKPRQKRKRNVETDAESVEKAEKRPCRRRGEDDEGNGRGHGHGGSKTGTENEDGFVNCQGTSLNWMPAARASSSKIINRPPVAAASSPAPTTSSSKKVSSVSQHMRRLAQDNIPRTNSLQSSYWNQTRGENAAANNEPAMENNDAPACEQTVSYDNTSHSTTDTYESSHNLANAFDIDRERRKLKALLLFSMVYTTLIVYAFSSIIYAQNFNHNLTILRRDARDSKTAQDQLKVIQREMHMHEQARNDLQAVHGHLVYSQEIVRQRQEELAYATKTHKMQIQEYEAIFQQHDEELIGAVERIKTLRGGKEESNSAIDLAWLRMDELMEENNELSNELKAVARVQLRDSGLILTVESLTHQLKLVGDEKDELNRVHRDLLAHSKVVAIQYDLLWHKHVEISDFFLAPILVYIQKLIQSSEQQHAIILDLTSLVHSLHSSLEMSRSHLETQVSESMTAVDAMAIANSELSLMKTQAYEMERVHYMHHMEMQLEQLEDEALGAVQAVAEAAGKLEYERKIEEEGRWKSYAEEAESILGGIRANIQDGSTHENSGYVLEGFTERSVLKAAISRRIEEGISSLRSYIHPYNYFKEGEDVAIERVENQSNE